jgi:ADP-heptose:LPS heptosyltransferase
MVTTLAIHPGALGDVILLARLCSMLGGPVTLVAHAAQGRLLQGLGVVARTIDFDAIPMHEVFSDKPLQNCRLPGLLSGYDRLISCLAAGDRAAELRLAMICGADNTAFLPVRPAEHSRGHLIELWCDLLGLAFDEVPRQAWPAPAAWRQQAQVAISKIGYEKPPVVIHPGSGGLAKCWPLERFLELGRLLKDTRQVRPLFVIGPAETDRWGTKAAGQIERRFGLLADPPLELLAGLLAGCLAYVGNDSGVSHLAAAVGAPSLVLFGASKAEHFAPLGPAVRVISRPSLAELSVQDVKDALGRVIA